MSAPANSAVYVDPSTGAISTGAVQFRNRIINGDMRIDQRLAGTANAALLTGQDVYTADRWAVWRNASGANYTVQRIANAGAPGNDFALQATVTSSATPGTNDIYFMHQKIEGYNVNDFGMGTANAAFFTISFHVRSSVTGTFGLIATNAAKNRSFATTYTVNAANVWEYKVITIKGDVTGTWAKNNTTGLDIIWSLGAGSGASTAAGAAWVAGGFYNVTGAVQFVGGAVGATFALTNVQVEKGGGATPFEVRPYAMELGMCQRYYEKSYANNTTPGTITALCSVHQRLVVTGTYIYVFPHVYFKVTKRANPNITVYSTGTGTAGNWTNDRLGNQTHSPFVDNQNSLSDYGFWVYSNTAYAIGDGISFHWVASAEI